MKSPQKKGNPLKGKSRLSLKKNNASSQSLAALFKKQFQDSSIRGGFSADSSTKTKDEKRLSSSDDDVQIVCVEVNESKYFSPEKTNISENSRGDLKGKQPSTKAGKLRLRRQGSSLTREMRPCELSVGKKDKKVSKKDECNKESDTPSLRLSQSSLKENASATSSSSCGTLSRKQSLRKRHLASENQETSSGSKTVKLQKYDSFSSDYETSSGMSAKNKPRGVKFNSLKSHKQSLKNKDPSKSTRSKSVTKDKLEETEKRDVKLDSCVGPPSKLMINDEDEIDTCFDEDSRSSTWKAAGGSLDDSPDKIPSSSATRDDDEDNDNVDDEDFDDKSKYRDRTPYYLENFTIILNSVLEDVDNLSLFSDEDLTVVNCFKDLSGMHTRSLVGFETINFTDICTTC